MSSQKPEPKKLQAHPIRRRQIQQQLAASSMITILALSGCGSSDDTAPEPEPVVPKVPALFYETTEQCEVDADKQQQAYQTQLAAYDENKLKTAPKPPPLDAADCAAQLDAAHKEHDRHAPVYQSLAACQADGVTCETTSTSSGSSGYRPTFGGTFIYPYTIGANSNFAGADYRVYQPHTVYQGAAAGQLVSPYGDRLPRSSPGRTTTPEPTGISAPARPMGYAAQGTITGRSRSGFGSSFKSTGSGGK